NRAPGRRLRPEWLSSTPLLFERLSPAPRVAVATALTARHEPTPSLRSMALTARPLPLADAPSLEELRCPRHHRLRALGQQLRKFLGRYGANLPTGIDYRTAEQRRGIQPGELLLDHTENTSQQQAYQSPHPDADGRDERVRSGRVFGAWGDDTTLSTRPLLAVSRTVPSGRLHEPVFDILNCGPQHQFVVRGDTEPFVVHNCVQGTARDLLAAALLRFEARGLPVVFHCHDEVVIEVPEGSITEAEVLAILLEPPPWATGLPLGGKMHSGSIYLDAPATGEPPAPKEEIIDLM